MRGSSEYIALPARSSSEDLLDSESATRLPIRGPSARARYESGSNDRLVFWAAIGVAFSTVFSMILFLTSVFYPPDVAASPRITTDIPRRPNPYRYLDGILANTTQKFDPITSFPPIVLQLNNADASRRMREDERGHATDFGTVYPDDRHILVTDQVSTVVQFRNLDYAMERCVLQIVMPEPSEHFDPAVKLADPSLVDVWLLDAPTELSRYIRGSMDYAPKRRELLTTLTFSRAAGSSHSNEFHCTSGMFTTLELTCSPTSSGCSVDFWQDQRAKPVGGLHIVQHPTPPPAGSHV